MTPAALVPLAHTAPDAVPGTLRATADLYAAYAATPGITARTAGQWRRLAKALRTAADAAAAALPEPAPKPPAAKPTPAVKPAPVASPTVPPVAAAA